MVVYSLHGIHYSEALVCTMDVFVDRGVESVNDNSTPPEFRLLCNDLVF